MKKIYYTVDYDLEQIDGNTDVFECVSGLKSVYLYSIQNNELKTIGDFETSIKNDTEEEIKNYLNDNGMGDEKYYLILL